MDKNKGSEGEKTQAYTIPRFTLLMYSKIQDCIEQQALEGGDV